MRRRAILFLLAAMVFLAIASPAWATPGGICIPRGHPAHDPPLCLT